YRILSTTLDCGCTPDSLFMRRSVVRLDEEQNAEEEKQTIDDEHWAYDIPQLKAKESKFQCEASYLPFEDLVFGRMSYKGFNKEIEKMMKEKNTEQSLAEADRREKEMAVSDDEMAERFTSLVGTVGKKFAKKRKKAEKEKVTETPQDTIDTVQTDAPSKKKKSKKKKKEFMKPNEDE
ncbi:unnamed protein product, partial [Owenia fusiformis]